MKNPGYRSRYLLEKPIIIYTAGKNGHRVLRMLRKLGVKPVAFADGSPKKIGKKLGGIKIEPFDTLFQQYGTTGAKWIAASTIYWNEINTTLRDAGIPEENILTEKLEEYAVTGNILRPINIDDETRKKLHAALLDMMIFFHDVCEKYDIPYYLYGGTLLGAVRHKGFIPWDDDVDFTMFRKDYDRFFEVVQNELGDKYNVHYSAVKYHRHKISLKNTKWRAWDSENDNEINIDIMPLDNVVKMEGALVKLQDLCLRKTLVLFRSGSLIGRCIKTLVPRSVCSVILNWIVRLSNKKDSEYVHFFCGEYGFIKDRTFPRVWFKERIPMNFKGHEFWVPKDYDKILRSMYKGDYMKLPPVGGRAIHPKALIDFEHGPDNLH
jgi:lipopolysaccharide cholinephosphotransferase